MRSLAWATVWRRRFERHALCSSRARRSPTWPASPAASTRRCPLRPTCRSACARAGHAVRYQAGAVGGSVAGQDLRPARDRAPVRGRRSAALAGRVSGQGAAAPRSQGSAVGCPTKLPAIIEAIAAALDGRCLDRAELAASLEARLGPWVTRKSVPGFNTLMPPWHLALAPAAAAGVLLFGPSRGTRSPTCGPTSGWVRCRPVDGQQALLEVARRFVRAYGPTTPVELARWFYTVPKCRARAVPELSDELEAGRRRGLARVAAMRGSQRPRSHPRACTCCRTSTATWSAPSRASSSFPRTRRPCCARPAPPRPSRSARRRRGRRSVDPHPIGSALRRTGRRVFAS